MGGCDAGRPVAAEAVDRRGTRTRRFIGGELGEVGSVSRLWLNRVLPEILRDYLTSPVSVLDVGCGSGVLVQQLDRLGIGGDYVGIDLAERPEWSELRSRENGLHAEFYVHDAHRVPELGRTFNAVVAVMAFEHLDDDVSALAALRRVMTEGAPIVIAVPAPAAALYLGRRHGFRWYGRRAILRLAEQGRFTVERVVTQRSGPGLLADALRLQTFRACARAVRLLFYGTYRGDRRSALDAHPWLRELEGILNERWLSLGGGRMARMNAVAGAAADRVLPLAALSTIAVLRRVGDS
jgi:SAM-dependent methyltransferase